MRNDINGDAPQLIHHSLPGMDAEDDSTPGVVRMEVDIRSSSSKQHTL